MMTPTIPLHYGHTGQTWPPGTYWLIEHVRAGSPRLYWMDATDKDGNTGWSYDPFRAAGFSTRIDASAAFVSRGRTAVAGGAIDAFEHIWEDAE